MYLYFIQAGDNGPIKIGVSSRVETRLRSLQTAHYEKLTCIKKTATKIDPYKIEKEIHRIFSRFRINGEWYSPDKYLTFFISSIRPLKATEQYKKRTFGIMTFSVFAKKIGVTPSAITKLLSGAMGPSADTLCKMSELLNIDAAELNAALKDPAGRHDVSESIKALPE